jgi:hypothetical protein
MLRLMREKALQAYRFGGTHNASTLWPVSCQAPGILFTNGEPIPVLGSILSDGHLERQSVLHFE